MESPLRSWNRILGIHCGPASFTLVLLVLSLEAPQSVQAQSSAYAESVLHSFTNAPDGLTPRGGVAVDSLGNIYGTTSAGGTGNPGYCASDGCGTAFKVDTTGKETVLYSFVATLFQGNRGTNPKAGLVLDALGNSFGTTSAGGTAVCDYPSGGAGCGTVFKLDAATGTQTVLYSFTGVAGDGRTPWGSLVLDAQGNLYGTTFAGGDRTCNAQAIPAGCGTVFKVDSMLRETVLYAFRGGTDGAFPRAGLIRDAQGNLYGTTSGGGVSGCSSGIGCGTVFKIDPTGKETVLYSFIGDSQGFSGNPPLTDGFSPVAGLARDVQGNLYGTTLFGGFIACPGSVGCGTVFKLDPSGKETVLHNFTSTGGDGAFPYSGMILDTQGNLYGTTYEGGNQVCDQAYNGCGTVFKIDTAGNETVLYTFSGGTDGGYPWAGLVSDLSGKLYGTTTAGGDAACNSQLLPAGCGTVFKLTPVPATTNTLTTSRKTSIYGQVITLRAKVVSKNGPPPNGDAVTFQGSSGPLGTGVLSAGVAIFSTKTLPAIAQTIIAVYGGDPALGASTSNVVQEVVAAASTRTTLVVAPNPAVLGQAVNFTVHVRPQISGVVVPGTVIIEDGAIGIGAVNLSNGAATFTTSILTAGLHHITAYYSDSANFKSSTSAAVTLTVK